MSEIAKAFYLTQEQAGDVIEALECYRVELGWLEDLAAENQTLPADPGVRERVIKLLDYFVSKRDFPERI